MRENHPSAGSPFYSEYTAGVRKKRIARFLIAPCYLFIDQSKAGSAFGERLRVFSRYFPVFLCSCTDRRCDTAVVFTGRVQEAVICINSYVTAVPGSASVDAWKISSRTPTAFLSFRFERLRKNRGLQLLLREGRRTGRERGGFDSIIRWPAFLRQLRATKNP